VVVPMEMGGAMEHLGTTHNMAMTHCFSLLDQQEGKAVAVPL
jgi:hypothetical protein